MNENRKFKILCALGIVWALLLGALLCGARLNPRIEQVVTIICLIWFAYWSISFIRSTPKNDETHNLGDHLAGNCGCSEKKEQSDTNHYTNAHKCSGGNWESHHAETVVQNDIEKVKSNANTKKTTKTSNK